MNVNFNTAVGNNTNFRAVNQKYLKAAEKSYNTFEDVSSEWYNSIRDNVVLWKGISIQDAVDTMLAVKKYVDEESMEVFNHVLNRIKQG